MHFVLAGYLFISSNIPSHLSSVSFPIFRKLFDRSPNVFLEEQLVLKKLDSLRKFLYIILISIIIAIIEFKQSITQSLSNF